MDMGWEDVRLFLAVAESRSMSGAARQLRLGQPTVSRRIAELEHALGYPLFRRAVSGVALTPAGERLLAPARRMAEWAGEVGRAASSSDRAVRGKVRVTAPPGVAWELVAPFAGWLRRKHPALQLEVLSSVGYLDLARGEADLALRLRPAAGADLVTVATLEHPNAAYASREYKARLPRRYGPAELDWLAWAPPYEDLPPNPQLAALIPGFTPAFTSDSYLVMLAAAEAGVGVLVAGAARHRFRRASGLVPLDLDLGPHARSALHLVCAKSALDIPRVRTVAELLAEELRRAAE